LVQTKTLKNGICCITWLMLRITRWCKAGAAPRGGLGENSSPSPHKGHFCKSSKTDEKILGVWGDDVTNHTWISAWLCHKLFSKTGSNLYFIHLL